MASNTETQIFALDLQDGMSGPASSAADALEGLRAKIEADTAALRQMNAAMARLRAGGQGASKAALELRDRIAAQKAALGQAQARYIDLGGSLSELGKKTQGASAGLADFASVAQGAPGPLGAIVGRLGALRGLLAGGPLIAGAVALAAGFLAIVAASAALVGAVGAAAASLLRYGLAQASARRSELLQLEGLVRLRSWYGLAAGSATELQSAVDRVSDATASGRGEISGYAQQIYRAGLRGNALSEALEGMAITASVQGEGMARRFAGMAAGAARAGRSVRALADDVRSRLGGIAARQALSFDRQMQQLRQNVSRIFDGLEIDGLLRGLRMVTSLFSQNTASGRALRQIVRVIFQPMIDGIARLGPIARRFFQGMILQAQRVVIFYLRVRNAVLRAFGATDILSGIDAQTMALQAGSVVVMGLVTAVVMAAGALATFVAMGAAAVAVVRAMLNPIATVQAAMAGLFDIGARAGSRLSDGLASGITQGRDRIVAAVRGLATGAADALRNALQIRSPSRVFAQLGVQIPAGLESGIDAGAPSAMGAVESMVAAPGAPSGRGGSGSRVSVSIGDVHIHAGSEQSAPRELAQSFADELVRLLEGASIEMGVAR